MKAEEAHNAVVILGPNDNVGVALRDLAAASAVSTPAGVLTAREAIPRGHKVALRRIEKGEVVIKYGRPIGRARAAIGVGSWVHVHNVASLDVAEARYRPSPSPEKRSQGGAPPPTFQGYLREDGRVGTRNEIWILPTVGCTSGLAVRLERVWRSECPQGPPAYAFVHQFGCSQLGGDLALTRRCTARLVTNPNAGGVLLVGLGCESNCLRELLHREGLTEGGRLRTLEAQKAADEIREGVHKLHALSDYMREDTRSEQPIGELVVGLQCGGSDSFSGITANVLVGALIDRLTGWGGRAILAEIPEIIGAEEELLRRCVDEATFRAAAALIESCKSSYVREGFSVCENPSPGNYEGGITTLQEKSLGAVRKAGTAAVVEVVGFGEPVCRRGVILADTPGNDLVSGTAEVASGATVILFTTGRGTPLGFPVPTVKIASTTELAERKKNWIDFDAGPIARGQPLEEAAGELLSFLCEVASGRRRTRNERNEERQIGFLKRGVTL